MKALIGSVTELLGPVGSSTLGHALIGLAILIIGLFIVKLIAGVFGKLLNKAAFLEQNRLTSPIQSLIKAILTIFVLMAVLQHFGLTDVLAPLKNMVNQFLSAVPRIIGAGVVAYAGWVIASIVSELARVALKKVDTELSLRTGDDNMKVARFGSAFIFVSILLPIVVAALGVLDIPAISGPATEMINELMAAIPNIIGACIILVVTYFVAKFVIYLLTGLLEGMSINDMPAKLGISGMFNDSFTPTKLIGGAIMFFSMLTATTAAVNTLGIDIISSIFAKILEFGGSLLVGCVILVIGNFLSALAYQKLVNSGNHTLAGIARVTILGLVLAMGLRAMGLADNIVNMAFGLTLGAVAVAAALAFGFGGRDAAKKVADSWASKVVR